MDRAEKKYIQKRRLKACMSRIPYYLCGLLPIKRKKIVFSAFEGGGYCCNPKYIAEELIRRDNEFGYGYEMVWLVNDLSKQFPPQIKKVKNTLWNRAYHLSTAKIWVDNARKNWGTRKRKGQFYLQTWHGMVGFKPVGRLRGRLFSKIAELVSVSDAKQVDMLLSNSDWCSNVWKNSFWGEPVGFTGSPRCDILFNKREYQRKLIREEYGINQDTKIVLYAPTFRGGSQTQNREVFVEEISLDMIRLMTVLENKFGSDWCVFIRLHPQLSLRNKKVNLQNDKRLIDVTKKDDLYELLAAVDAVVTDYSSMAFDAASVKIPVFLYVDDYDEYVADRGSLLWTEEENPFPIAKDNDSLEVAINNFDEQQYVSKLEKVFQDINLFEDGKASERVADIIERKIKEK